MNITKKGAILLGGLGLVSGIAGTVAMQTHAANTAIVSPLTTSTTPATADLRPHGHAPLGGDGNITAINGTTITMQEEADEGGASYTVDASKATVTNNGASATLQDLKIGDKIFVQGTTSGTNVAATSISVGHPGGQRHGGMPTVQSN
jgi:hypothetical protein